MFFPSCWEILHENCTDVIIFGVPQIGVFSIPKDDHIYAIAINVFSIWENWRDVIIFGVRSHFPLFLKGLLPLIGSTFFVLWFMDSSKRIAQMSQFLLSVHLFWPLNCTNFSRILHHCHNFWWVHLFLPCTVEILWEKFSARNLLIELQKKCHNFWWVHLSWPCTVDGALTSPFKCGAEHKNPLVNLMGKVDFQFLNS